MHAQPEVPFLQPADDPPEGEEVDVAEGAFAHPVTEVVAPSPQHRVQPAEQVCKRSMLRSASQRPHLAMIEAIDFFEG